MSSRGLSPFRCCIERAASGVGSPHSPPSTSLPMLLGHAILLRTGRTLVLPVPLRASDLSVKIVVLTLRQILGVDKITAFTTINACTGPVVQAWPAYSWLPTIYVARSAAWSSLLTRSPCHSAFPLLRNFSPLNTGACVAVDLPGHVLAAHSE